MAKDRFAEPTAEAARAIGAALRLIEAFRSIEPAMPTSYAAAFLAVAHKPGLGVGNYAQALGMLAPVASRVLLEIGQKTRTGGPGLGLVDNLVHPTDLRFKQFFLTNKGEKLLASVLSAVQGAHR